jgi:hypothetical protein
VRTYLGIGDSHLKSVTAAWEEYQAIHPEKVRYTSISPRDKELAPWFLKENGVHTPNPRWVSAMREAIPGSSATIMLCLASNRNWAWSLTPGPEPFDFIDPEDPRDQGLLGQLIPYDLFMRRARSEYRSIKIVTDVLRGLTDARIVHFIPPPAIRSLQGMFDNRPDMKHLIADHGLSPAPYRLKIWRACARALTEVCVELGIEAIMPPAKALDADGYLAEEYVGDVIHGNIAWGRLHVENLMNRADREMEMT